MNDKLSTEVNAILDQLATLPVEESFAQVHPLMMNQEIVMELAKDKRLQEFAKTHYKRWSELAREKQKAIWAERNRQEGKE